MLQKLFYAKATGFEKAVSGSTHLVDVMIFVIGQIWLYRFYNMVK